MFYGASTMNADLSGWDIAKVRSLQTTFFKSISFVGNGLGSWNIAQMHSVVVDGIFTDVPLSSCNKRLIARAWQVNIDFRGTSYYKTDWATDTCPLTDLSFKKASCKLLHPPHSDNPTPQPLPLPVCCSIILYLFTTRCFVLHTPKVLGPTRVCSLAPLSRPSAPLHSFVGLRPPHSLRSQGTG